MAKKDRNRQRQTGDRQRQDSPSRQRQDSPSRQREFERP